MSAAPGPPQTRPDDTPLRLAVETTLLLWVRTGVALMAFGFFIARFGLVFEEFEELGLVHPGRGARPTAWSGVGFVLAGCATCLLAAWCHSHFLRRLPPPRRELPPTLPWGLAVAVAVALAGLALAAYLILSV
jgi:putative membrane protein